MKNLVNSNVNVTLEIIGDGYIKKESLKKVSEYKLDNSILFKGWEVVMKGIKFYLVMI